MLPSIDDLRVCVLRYWLVGLFVAVVAMAAFGLLRGRTPPRSVEECNCVVNDEVAWHGRLDANGECQPVPCGVFPESPSLDPEAPPVGSDSG